MPTPTAYTYDIAAAFATGSVNPAKLEAEIRASAIVIALDRIDTEGSTNSGYGVVSGGILSIHFRDALSSGDKTLLDGDTNAPAGGLLAAHVPAEDEPVPTFRLAATNIRNAPIFASGSRPPVPQFLDCTFNWCDPRSWYSRAKAEVGAELTKDILELTRGKYFLDDGNGDPVPYWIDTWNYRVYRGYEHPELTVSIYLDGVKQTIAPPGKTTADGYQVQIDFSTGIVLFALGTGLTGTVTADFYHVDQDLTPQEQTTFVMVQQPNMSVLIERVEIQFTNGVDIRDTAIFAAFAPLGYMAVQSDATLDPLAVSTSFGYSSIQGGDAYLITDKDNLHANFGVIDGLGNGDIVMFTKNIRNKPDQFRVWFDASEGAVGTKARIYALGSDPYPTVQEWNGAAWGTPGYGAPSKIEVPNSRDQYPTFESYLNDATGNYATIPAGFAATTSGRGCGHSILQIPLNWLGAKEINSSLGVELRVWLENGIPFGPDTTHFATATFYGTVLDLE